MSRVLITAFGPYGQWQENSSWLALVELTRNLPDQPAVTTRLYPVDLEVVRERLEKDLSRGFDYVLHLGQAPGASSVQLETIGINVRASSITDTQQPLPLVADGAVAYQSRLPLARWAGLLRDIGIPARVSYHAGTYLCNATLYLTHHFCVQRGWPTQATFLHLPLTCSHLHAGDGNAVVAQQRGRRRHSFDPRPTRVGAHLSFHYPADSECQATFVDIMLCLS